MGMDFEPATGTPTNQSKSEYRPSKPFCEEEVYQNDGIRIHRTNQTNPFTSPSPKCIKTRTAQPPTPIDDTPVKSRAIGIEYEEAIFKKFPNGDAIIIYHARGNHHEVDHWSMS